MVAFACVRVWVLVAAGLLSFSRLARAQLGTAQTNVSSNSTQLSYVSTWRSQIVNGTYEAFSNYSDAKATFYFVGVGASYVAIKSANRGLCQLKLDQNQIYTIDLYDDSGYAQAEQVIWTSPTLVYGEHNISIFQIGEDARLGYYPYLFTETWIEVVPTNVAAYTSTEIIPSGTGTASPTSTAKVGDGHTTSDFAPIVGGVVGGVVACALLGFLLYLWKRDKAARARGEIGGVKVPKAKKADGKMAIDDEPKQPPPTHQGPPQSSYDMHSNSYHSSSQPIPSYYSQQPPPGPIHTHSADAGTVPLLQGTNRFGPPSPDYRTQSMYSSPHAYDYPASATAGEVMPSAAATTRPGQAYPYLTQGFGGESRSYPVPEI